MRTTLTLDDDVAAMLARVRRDRAIGLKAAVNEALRRGLRELSQPAAPRAPYRTPSVSVGRLLVDIECVGEALAIAEGDAYR